MAGHKRTPTCGAADLPDALLCFPGRLWVETCDFLSALLATLVPVVVRVSAPAKCRLERAGTHHPQATQVDRGHAADGRRLVRTEFDHYGSAPRAVPLVSQCFPAGDI